MRTKCNFLALSLLLAGCLPPPQMDLAEVQRRSSAPPVWWVAVDEPELTGPIVGVEQRVSESHTRQWLIDDRGVRIFDFKGQRLSSWSPPLPSHALREDFLIVRPIARSEFGHEPQSSWPGPPLPEDEVNRMTCSADLVALLARHWPDARTDPPKNLAGHDIAEAMEQGKFDVLDLDKAFK